MLVALLSVPILIRNLGTDRFGVLTLIWVLIGYSSLFDLGIGRALTKLVAERIGSPKAAEIPGLVWTSLAMMAALGVVGTVLGVALSGWLTSRAFRISPALQDETRVAFALLSLSIPIVISMSGLRGVLEAMQRFGWANAIRIPLGAFAFLGPLAVLPFSHSLVPIVCVLIVGRVIGWLVHLWAALGLVPGLRDRIHFQRSNFVPLLHLGGWMTVSNVVGPLMVYLDRIFIGGLVSMTAVAYYATPYEAVTKLWLFPSAVAGVLFPHVASTYEQDTARMTRLFLSSVKYTALLLFPFTLLIIAFGRPILSLWLGEEFASRSAFIFECLAFGVFLNSLAQLPFTLLQAAGRPDLTAKLHLAELPLYLLAFWYLVRAHGIDGAAVAWVLRVVIDTVILFLLAAGALSGIAWIRRTFIEVGTTVAFLVLVALPVDVRVKTLFTVAALGAFPALAWFASFTDEERAFLRRTFRIGTVPVLREP
jgi:O-antigen/teichoic acid export membrane protein